MKILLAALLLLPAATVRADDEEPPAEEEQAAEPSAPSAPAPGSARRGGPSFSGAKPAPKRTAPGTIDADGAVGVGGAGLGRDESKPEKVYDRTQGLPAGAASAVGAAQAAAEAPVVKTTVYQSWKDVPPWKGNRSKWLVDFAGGPGTAFSVGFKAEGADGTFAFVEDINSTDACWYAAWISAKPGGIPLAEAGGNPHKPCGMLETQWTGGQLQWKTKDRRAWDCPLKEGGRYYFNFMLKKWGPNLNGLHACVEHVTPQGSSAPHIVRQ